MTIELSELSAHVGELRRRIEAGEEVTLVEGGRAVAKVLPEPPPPTRPARVLGMHPGAFNPTPDFDDPLPDEFWLGDDA